MTGFEFLICPDQANEYQKRYKTPEYTRRYRSMGPLRHNETNCPGQDEQQGDQNPLFL